MYPSTLSSWALLIAKALRDYDINVDELFVEADLDLERLQTPGARYDFVSLTKLWNLAEQASKDPCFGLKVSQYWHPTTFHALGYSWLACANLKEAFLRLERYGRMISNAVRVKLLPESGQYRFTLVSTANCGVPANVAIDASLSVIVHMCRISVGETFSPLKVCLMRPAPELIKPYLEFFQAEVEFNADENTLVFGKEDIDSLLPTSNSELVLCNDQLILNYLSNFEHNDIVLKLKSTLIDQLPTGLVTESTISEAVNMSSRTLQRKLKQQGTNFTKLLSQTRKELAIHYLSNSNLTISEITYLLGFSEPANFSRAFKGWMNVSPSVYRSAA